MAELEEDFTREIESLLTRTTSSLPQRINELPGGENIMSAVQNILPHENILLDKENILSDGENILSHKNKLPDVENILPNDENKLPNGENVLSDEIIQNIDYTGIETSPIENIDSNNGRHVVMDKLSTFIDSLNNCIEELFERNQQLEDELKSKYISSAQQNENSKGLVEQLQKKVTELEHEKEQYSQDSIEQYDNAIGLSEQLQTRVADLEREKEQYSQETEQRMKDLVETEDGKHAKITNSLSEKIEELETEISEREEKIKQLENGHSLNEETIEILQLKLEELSKESVSKEEKYDQDVHGLNATVDDLRRTNEELQYEVEIREKQELDKSNLIEEQIKQLEETKETLKLELAAKTEHIDQMERAKSDEIAELNRSFEENSEKLRVIFAEHQDLQVVNRELEEKLTSKCDAEDLLRDRDSEISRLNETLELVQHENVTLEERYKMVQEESLLSESKGEADFEDLNVKIEEKCKEYEDLLQIKDELHLRNSELETLISSKEAEIENMLLEKEKEVTHLNTTVEENRMEMARLEEQNLTLEQTIQHQMEEFQESLSCREKEINLLNKSVEDTTGGLLRLKEENVRLLTDAQQLEKNLLMEGSQHKSNAATNSADNLEKITFPEKENHPNGSSAAINDDTDLTVLEESRSELKNVAKGNEISKTSEITAESTVQTNINDDDARKAVELLEKSKS